jgi:hypothetical protein
MGPISGGLEFERVFGADCLALFPALPVAQSFLVADHFFDVGGDAGAILFGNAVEIGLESQILAALFGGETGQFDFLACAEFIESAQPFAVVDHFYQVFNRHLRISIE